MTIYRDAANDSAALASLFNAYGHFYKQKTEESYLGERLSKEELLILIVGVGDELLGFTQLYPGFSWILMKRACARERRLGNFFCKG